MFQRQREYVASYFLITSLGFMKQLTPHMQKMSYTHTHHTKGCVLSLVTHAAYLFVSSNVLHNALFISTDFPQGKQVCLHVSAWCVCVPAEAQVWVFISPQGEGSQPLLKLFHCVLSFVFTTDCDFLSQAHKVSTEQRYSFHTKPPVGNDNLIIF